MEQISRSSRIKSIATFVLGIILICVVFELVGKIKGNPLVFPGGGEVLKTFFRLMGEPQTYRLILTTLVHLFVSLLISFSFGVAIGVAEGLCNFLHKLLYPLMTLLRSIPMIVLVVITMVLVSYSRVPYIVCALVLVPLISEAVCEGCRNIDRDLVDVYRMNGSFSLRILFAVYIPLVSGYLKQSFVNVTGIGIKIIVTTEYLVQTKDSLGKAIFTSGYFNEYQEIYAYALIMILLVLLFTELPLSLIRLLRKKQKK